MSAPAPRAAEDARSFSFLVNPLSGGGAAPGAVVPVARLLRDAGASVEVTYSPGPRATLDLVRTAVGRGDVVVSVGGDGMLSSIAGEVAALGGTLGIVPADVARVLLEAEPAPVDLVDVELPDGGSRVVAGSVYAGVDARAAEIVDRAHWLPRRLQYPFAAVRSLATFTPATYSLVLDGTGHEVRAATVVVANSGCYGSGMRIAPDASVTDGHLDVVVIGAAGRLDLIRSLPKVYDGSHVALPEVRVLRARHVELSVTDAPVGGIRMGAEGERLPALVPGTRLSATVLPGALNLLT